MDAMEPTAKSSIKPVRANDAAADYLYTAVVIGLLSGVLHFALFELKSQLGILTLIGLHIVWLWPPLYALLFLPPALVMLGFSRRWPRPFSVRNLAALLVFLGALSALHVFDIQLGRPPLYILALGMATLSWRGIGERADAFRRAVRRATPWLVGAAALAGVAVNGGMALSERRFAAALPTPAEAAPNVLLIILDTVRGLSMGLYGATAPTTPQLSRWAARGVVFDRAVAPTSWTGPSHGTMWTGQWPHDHTMDWSTGLDGTHRTLPEALRDRGYRTGAFIANTRYVTRDAGLGRGFGHYEDHRQSLGSALAATWFGRFVFHKDTRIGRWLGIRDVMARKRASDITDSFLRWSGQGDGRPFLAVLNYLDAHDPYLPPEPFASAFGVVPPRSFMTRVVGRIRRMVGGGGPTLYSSDPQEQVATERRAYEATIAYLDADMDRLLRTLEQRGVLPGTLVILVGDHGEEFAEHGTTIGHGKSLYWPVLQVPLMVWFQGKVPEGLRVTATASLRNLPATIMDLVAGTQDGFPGASWARLWLDSLSGGDTALAELSFARGPSNVPVSKGDMKSVTIGQYHFIRNGDGSEELYDIAADPWERRNLMGLPEAPALQPFRDVLAAIPQRQRELRRTW